MMHHDGRTPQFSNTAAYAFLAGRVLAALAFLALALGQLMHFEDAARSAGALGMPMSQSYIALNILLEMGGSIALALGYRARLGAALLAVSLLPSLWLFADAAANRVFLAGTLAALGGLLPYIVLGAGPYCLDGVYRALKGE